jgi:hypothetical protein
MSVDETRGRPTLRERETLERPTLKRHRSDTDKQVAKEIIKFDWLEFKLRSILRLIAVNFSFFDWKL